mmetsp:Transcript_94/g.181  ORF Transcript_94/g.181 Transcript_94/m.181 type:complete len:494 (-) Transcript_94:258-1739(-)
MSTRSSRRGKADKDEEVEEKPDEVQEEKEKEEEAKEDQEDGEETDEEPEENPEEPHEENGEDHPKDKVEDDPEKQQEQDDQKEKDAEEQASPVVEGESTRMQDKENDPPAGASPKDKGDKQTPDDAEPNLDDHYIPQMPTDPKLQQDMEIIKSQKPSSDLELALTALLSRKEAHIDRLSGEVQKLKAFISKRKQTYKRKRKDEGAPTRALSAYNIFVQDRFSRLAKENEQALKSADTDAQLRRVPPASLVASTGNEWKELPAEQKAMYEERAREDRKRYEEQMAKYQPPDKAANRKRNKTGYNMFFSAHVLRLKQSEAGVPSERGSVARLVGNAWKQLSAEDKQYYEREADKQNGMNPVEKEEEEEDEEAKRVHMDQYGHPMHSQHMHGGEMHGGMPPPPMGQHGQPMHPSHHDPRGQHPGYYPGYHMPHGQYPPPPPPQHQHYDQQYQQHYQQHDSRRREHRSSSGHNYPHPPPPPPPPPPQGHYDQRGMGV